MKMRKIAIISVLTVAVVVALTQAAPIIWTFARKGVQDFHYGAGTESTFIRPNQSGGMDTLSSISPIPVTAYGVRGIGTVRDADSLAVAIAAVDAMGGGDLYFPKPVSEYNITGCTITNANTRAIGYVPAGLVGGAPRDIWGDGSPEGVYVAPVGSIYRSMQTGAGDIYVKKTGTAAIGWFLVSGASGTSGDISAPVLTAITGLAQCDNSVVNLIINATTDERSKLVLAYRRNSNAWSAVTTSTDPFRSPSLYHTIATGSLCVVDDVYEVRVSAVDSVGNLSAILSTLTLQLPSELPVISTDISMGPTTVTDGDLVAHVTGTVTGGSAYRKRLFRKHDSSYAALSSIYWKTAGDPSSSFADSFVSGWAEPVALADSFITIGWTAGSGAILFYRLEYRYPPVTTWSVLDSLIPFNVSDEYEWDNHSVVQPKRGPIDLRICAVTADGFSSYAYLDSVYYNQSELIEATYYAMADTTADASTMVTDTDYRIFRATSPVAGDTLAPPLTTFRIAAVDSYGTPMKVRARVTAGCDSIGSVVSIFHKWGYDGTWADTVTTTVATSSGLDYYDSTGSATSVLPDTLWIGAFATKNGLTGDVVRDDIYVSRAVPAGATDFNYIFVPAGGGVHVPYGSPGRTIKPVFTSGDDPAEYWWVRGGLGSVPGDQDSTAMSNTTAYGGGIAVNTSSITFRSYSSTLSLLGANRGLVICYHWPNLAAELATATDIDTFRVHVYSHASSISPEYSLASGDTFAIALVTDEDMQEPVDGISDNTTGQYVDSRSGSLTTWAISPLQPKGHSFIDSWAPGSWEGFGVAEKVEGGLHIEFTVTKEKVEAAIATGTWDGTFAFWIASRQLVAPRFFNMYGPACPDASFRPSIIVKGKK